MSKFGASWTIFVIGAGTVFCSSPSIWAQATVSEFARLDASSPLTGDFHGQHYLAGRQPVIQPVLIDREHKLVVIYPVLETCRQTSAITVVGEFLRRLGCADKKVGLCEQPLPFTPGNSGGGQQLQAAARQSAHHRLATYLKPIGPCR